MPNRGKRVWLQVAVLTSLTLSVVAKETTVAGDDVFKDRILPIFRSKDPSSCTECHLAAVELKDYIRPTARETFLSLRDQGLIDLEQPAQSRILELIRMAPKQAAPLPSRRRAEELAARQRREQLRQHAGHLRLQHRDDAQVQLLRGPGSAQRQRG